LPQVEYRRDAEGFIIPPIPQKLQAADSPALLDADNPRALDALAAEHGDPTDQAAGTETPPEDSGRGRVGRRSQPRMLEIDREWEEDEQELEEQISEIINDPHSLEHARAFSTAEQRARIHMEWANSLNPPRQVSTDATVGEDEFADDPEVEN